jgi:hypothetical protein
MDIDHNELSEIFAPFVDAINELADAIIALGNCLAEMINNVTSHPTFQFLWRIKWDSESWGDYLHRVGSDVLDNPDIRWAYQKHILGTPLRWVRGLF